MIVKLSFCVALVMLAFSAVPVSAHHGWGGNVDETSDLTGVVVASVSLAGPHATMKIRVGEQVWDMTLAPPAATERAGLKEGVIPVGATVTVHGNRNRDPKRFEMKCTRVTWNGKTYDVYPGRS
jgi:Flp pilus assembly protein CpaB